MTQNRRMFLQSLSAVCFHGALASLVLPGVAGAQEGAEGDLPGKLVGSWRLKSYTYTSNNRTYTSPDEMEAIANFAKDRYDANFSTHISRLGMKRTRRASESGTYSVDGERIRLIAEEASSDSEKGEEFLADVKIEGDTLRLTSNNGNNQEVWERVSEE